MAFISDKERDSLVKQANKTYTGRKVFFFISMALTLAFIVILVVFSFLGQKGTVLNNYDWYDETTSTITIPGWIFIAITAIIVIMDVISLILMLCVISPKDSQKVTKKLQSSPLSGVKTKKRGTNVSEAARERMVSKKSRQSK
ncbi:MAG: hypothetical protein HUJ52_01055 [Malacoplasma sp.]|nr:hypothetical protein [Malacoplasma sp.]